MQRLFSFEVVVPIIPVFHHSNIPNFDTVKIYGAGHENLFDHRGREFRFEGRKSN
jgi:hypothetical protein